VLALLLCSVIGLGQSAAELQRILPYSKAVQTIPGLTYDVYLTAINKMAQENLATGSLARSPQQVPVYVPSTGSTITAATANIGNNTFTNWSNGASSTTNRIGNYTFTGFNDGSSATRTHIGGFGFTDFSNGISATSTQIGQFGLTNYSNGLSSTTTRIGGFTFTNFNDGSSATTTRLGQFGFTTYMPPPTLLQPTLPASPILSLGGRRR
jgi:hypothetical protein